jgi:hypothetical protein
LWGCGGFSALFAVGSIIFLIADQSIVNLAVVGIGSSLGFPIGFYFMYIVMSFITEIREKTGIVLDLNPAGGPQVQGQPNVTYQAYQPMANSGGWEQQETFQPVKQQASSTNSQFNSHN